jgi:hypothetical protein
LREYFLQALHGPRARVKTLRIATGGMRMPNQTVYLVLALCIVALLVGALVVAFLASGARSEKKRKEEMATRHLARQPWDAQSADGRGNR